ncbi:MAG: response regulator [Limisphaerales bacterium]
MSTPTASILIVEDEPKQLRHYARTLKRYRLTCVPTGTAALAALTKQIPDLIILDHILAGGELGTDFLPQLKAAAAHVPIIVISGTLDIQGQLAALQGPHAARYVLEKPVDLDELDSMVETALTNGGLGEIVRLLRSLEKAEKIESNEPERRFTERLARQHELLERVRKSGELPNISSLAREFNVDRKTIRRDLHDLIQRGQLDPAVYPQWNDAATADD